MTYFDDIVGDAITAFADALRDAGFRLRGQPVMDGIFQRVAVEGDRGRKQSGSYWGRLDGDIPYGFMRNFKDESRTGGWRYKAARPMRSAAEHEAAQRIMEDYRAKKAAELAAKQAAAAKACRADWSNATPAPATQPYVLRKGISPNGLRVLANRLLVPMADFSGEVQGVQTIYADGTKRFRKDGTTKNLHRLLGNVEDGGWLLGRVCKGQTFRA
jgi:putative DNA primase/helicase